MTPTTDFFLNYHSALATKCRSLIQLDVYKNTNTKERIKGNKKVNFKN